MADIYRAKIEIPYRQIIEDRGAGPHRVFVVQFDNPSVALWLQGEIERKGKTTSTSLRAVRIGWNGGLSFE